MTRKRRGRITAGEASQILSGLDDDRADFHSLRSDEVQYLLDTAKEISYRAPKNASGSTARYFYAYLQKRRSMRVRENPHKRDFRGRFKKKRYASPSEAREIFDRMYARGDAEHEAHLRTQEGEAERQEFNRRQRMRFRQNPNAGDEARELALFIESDGQIYRSQTLPIIKNLQIKIAKGKYNPTLALKLWRHLADRGAQDYNKQHGSPGVAWHQVFSTAARQEAARLLQETYEEHVREGKYSVGDRVELSPATDWWMRGARYGEIRNINPPVATIKLDKVSRPVRVHFDNISKVISPAGSERVSEPKGGWNGGKRIARRKNPRGRYPAKVTLREAKKQLALRDITITKKHTGEYRVNFKGGKEATAYYSDDLRDAFQTGVDMHIRRHGTHIGTRTINPIGKFFIGGHARGRTWFYRHSTQSFTDSKGKATAYRSRAHAERIAKTLVNRLPTSIESITVKP